MVCEPVKLVVERRARGGGHGTEEVCLVGVWRLWAGFWD